MPSMVVMLLPAAWMAGTRQEVTSRPSMMTEQAPHSPSPQPSLVPVRRRSFRMMSISRVIGSTSAERSSPFTVSSMCIVSSNSKVFETVAFNEERTEFNDTLKVLTEQLRESPSIQDAFYSINLERQCIAVEQFLRPDKLDELNQQLLKSSAAEQGLRFVMDAGTYKVQIEKVFIHGITELPSGEPYERFVSDQKRYLEVSKKNFRTLEELDFFKDRKRHV